MASTMTMAEAVATMIESETGYATKVWEHPSRDEARVYVSRDLSRRGQEMGFVVVEADGAINANGITRQAASIRQAAEQAIALMQLNELAAAADITETTAAMVAAAKADTTEETDAMTTQTTDAPLVQITAPAEFAESADGRAYLTGIVESHTAHRIPTLAHAEVEVLSGDVWDVRIFADRLDDAQRGDARRRLLDAVTP